MNSQDTAKIIRLLEQSPDGLTDEEIAEQTGVPVHEVVKHIKEIKPYRVGSGKRTLVKPTPEGNIFRDKQREIRRVEEHFLKREWVSAMDLIRDLDLSRPASFRYINEIRHKLISDDRHKGEYYYVPSDEDMEYARLILSRATREGMITDEDITLAKMILNRVRADAG
jgi:biotin operon repressor